MTALSRNVTRRQHGLDPIPAQGFAIGVAAAVRIYQYALIGVTQGGYLTPASADASLYIVGVAPEERDNTSGAAGDLTLTPMRGVYYFANSSSTDAIVDADVGRFAYVVDDNTVARTSSGGARPIAGVIAGVDSYGVAVEVGVRTANADGAIDVLFLAGADLSTTGQFLFVKLNGSSQIVLADTAGEAALGVLQNAPANGAVARVRVQGVSKVVADGTLADGAILATTASTARAKAAVAGTVAGGGGDPSNDPAVGSFAMGRALSDGTSGNAMTMLVQPMGLIPTTAA